MSKKRTIFDIVFVSILGTLLHFTYEWSGKNTIVGFFSAVNESTWEHLKLLFWPVFILSLAEYFLFERGNNLFLPARLVSVISGMLTIVTLYYTITGIIGKNISFINIAIYYIAVIITFIVSYLIRKNVSIECRYLTPIALIGFLIIAAVFIFFTNNAPEGVGIFAIPFAE